MKLADAVQSVVDDLDVDGGGYRTTEAASLLFSRAEAEQGARLAPLARSLARKGAQAALKDHKVERQAQDKAASAAASSALSTQRDFAELVPDMGWTAEYTALDETHDAVRKRVAMLNYPECLQVIALKTRKAQEAAAMARRLQRVVDENPTWARHPGMTLAEVLANAVSGAPAVSGALVPAR